eukprot:TRINITY_DN2190_c0_g1_i4.p1 TRINITY_DN2190_c0_g1~~TRINITY_DN2190_c0_g1_i4.p1  ORF type:complete len:358 (+),score=64.60 TRINITY_DN2190_c0_g1_i4:116-1189(+)
MSDNSQIPQDEEFARFWSTTFGEQKTVHSSQFKEALLRENLGDATLVEDIIEYILVPLSSSQSQDNKSEDMIAYEPLQNIFLTSLGPFRECIRNTRNVLFGEKTMGNRTQWLLHKWFHGCLSRGESDALLNGAPQTSWIVRWSSNQPGVFILSYTLKMANKASKPRQQKITHENGKVVMYDATGSRAEFNKLADLSAAVVGLQFDSLPSELALRQREKAAARLNPGVPVPEYHLTIGAAANADRSPRTAARTLSADYQTIITSSSSTVNASTVSGATSGVSANRLYDAFPVSPRRPASMAGHEPVAPSAASSNYVAIESRVPGERPQVRTMATPAPRAETIYDRFPVSPRPKTNRSE